MRKKEPATNPPALEDQNAVLRSQLDSVSRDNESLARENGALAEDNARLAAEVAEMSGRIAELEVKLGRVVELLKLANLRHFAPKSEKASADQLELDFGDLSLFNDAEADADPAAPEPELAGGGNPPSKPRRRGGKRRIDTTNMERVVIEHEIEDPRCPRCGGAMSEMKVEVTEVIRLVPAHLVVEEHRRRVYKCRPCCDANAAGEDVGSQIVRSPMPALTPIPGSFATASMLSYVINAKYANSMPYYRLGRCVFIQPE